MQDNSTTSPNPELQLAEDFVQYTRHNIFLTGKAGTGKTTFLHNLKHHTAKRMIVTAPTGVAAINAGGVTLHSFFQLPFGPHIPGSEMRQRYFSKEKINIIKGLDLLVIDEISMVRADLLDSIDAVLRRFKHRHLPFGGVQLLMIGDLHQLSPVIKDDEWQLLKPHYDSCYFFSSHGLAQTEMISIELKRIYRQSDADFIELLNRVRDDRLDSATVQILNSRHRPDFTPAEESDYITLTTHNRKADQTNELRLHALPSKPRTFTAQIEGDYPEYSYPTAAQLILKNSAQVMFVRNDNSPEKRYYNGKIGRIIHIGQDHITVRCPDDTEIQVEPITWENIKYTLDGKTQEISEEVIGRFTQLPVRLAWAITIHKSQGLTFERAIIDAQAAFSHGQVYVALSRCKTFEGMVLSTPLTQDAIKTDPTVASFVENAGRNPPTQEQLSNAKIHYQQQLLLECFDVQSLLYSLKKLGRLLQGGGNLIHSPATASMPTLEGQFIKEISIVADKFKRQLQSLFDDDSVPEQTPHLQERVQKASDYFTTKLQSGLTSWLNDFGFETDNKELRKQINKALNTLRHQLMLKRAALDSCRDGFTTSAYLNALARAEIEFDSKAHTNKQPDQSSDQEIEHPRLFHALKAWRAEQAATEQVEHYRILHQRVLIQIATLLPGTLDALLRVNGVGKATAEKYGTRIIAIVNDYCREHDTQAQPLAKRSHKTNEQQKSTKQISHELFLQGKTIPEIAEIRGLVTSTIETHLSHYVGLGELDIKCILTEEKIALIKQAAETVGRERSGPIKEQLGEAYSYGEIRLVLASLC